MAECRHGMLGRSGVRKASSLTLTRLRAPFCCPKLPGGSRAITALPTAPELRACVLSCCGAQAPAAALAQALPQWRCFLDELGDHRAACPVAGVLGPQGAPLERAAARICREGGARVATNVLLRDMNIDVPLADSRRIEVLANGLPLWQGAQVAVDTTFVNPVLWDGSGCAGADRVPGKAAVDAGRRWRRKRQTTYPELLAARRCRLVVLAVEVGGRFGAELADAVLPLFPVGPGRPTMISPRPSPRSIAV